MKLSKEQIKEIWEILVVECGAHLDDEPMFIQGIKKGTTEYRFCGHLGFGGKIYLDKQVPRVSCYPEDSTKEREAMVISANIRLGKLCRSWCK